MEDKCVCCGAIIPEGRQVCESCEKGKRKFTDDEVIKALECCSKEDRFSGNWCSQCPFLNERCAILFPQSALALVNRQKADIERMAKLVVGFEENCNTAIKIIDRWEKAYASAKAEAIKEFAERLKATPVRFASITGFGNPPIMGKKVLYIDDNDIDDLVKEMTEGGE